MIFSEKYKLTFCCDLAPKFRSVAMNHPWNKMEAGIYNNGMITILMRVMMTRFCLAGIGW